MKPLADALARRALPRDSADWNALLTAARAELLLGSLAYELDGTDVPTAVGAILADAKGQTEQGRVAALWEAEMARRALAPIGCPVVLLKGTAYAAAGLSAGRGRHIGDLDILVPREALDDVEAALLGAGWEWVKPDPYDDAYYRRHMHELPPLIHRERDRMIDIHHTILPLTARVRPDPAGLIERSVPLETGLRVLGNEDMIVHSAAHLFADGDLSGGLRNLWDIACLLRDFETPEPARSLDRRAAHHGLADEVARARRLATWLYQRKEGDLGAADRIFLRRLLARDGWGRETRPATRLGYYVRSHWLRMPPAMLARHLWTKARR